MLGPKVLNVTKAQAETAIQPNHIRDSFWREALSAMSTLPRGQWMAFEAGVILAFCHKDDLELRYKFVNLTMPFWLVPFHTLFSLKGARVLFWKGPETKW